MFSQSDLILHHKLVKGRFGLLSIVPCHLKSLGDGRWRMVIRRCASVSDTGVTGVCNWGVLENGVYWEECYCSHDGCNGSSTIT